MTDAHFAFFLSSVKVKAIKIMWMWREFVKSVTITMKNILWVRLEVLLGHQARP